MTAQLFTPVELGGVTLPNRIVVSPMCQYAAADGSAQPWHQVHYGMLAMSGAGLLCLEATHVERDGPAVAEDLAHCVVQGRCRRDVELSDRPDFNDKFVDQLAFPTG